MKIIKDHNELSLEIVKTPMYSARNMSTNYNDSVSYDCGCQKNHILNDPNLLIFSGAKPVVKFIFLCPNKYFSLVSVKGFFKTKAECVWTCKKRVFTDYLKAIKMYDSLQDERFK
ncbi:hypothetical protein OAP71_02035 [Pelagibacteraceae bacterium]|nr:hypothetical protein [Pelagibacteraceae bacterium]